MNRRKLFAGIAVAGALAGGGTAVAAPILNPPAIPAALKLKVAKDDILYSVPDQTGKVSYFYQGPAADFLPNEIPEKRTSRTITFRTKKQDTFVKRFYFGDTFIKDATTGTWQTIETATTTSAAFDQQTLSFFQIISRHLLPIAYAASTTLFVSQDTYYGSAFSPGPNHTNTNLSIGGWGDHYYTYVQFDLTGGPSSGSATKADLCFKTTGTTVNWPGEQIRRVTSSWAESTLTRTNLPTDDGATGQITQTIATAANV
jgi:hypothetical protein